MRVSGLKRGEAHWHNKLTGQQVLKIRRLARAGMLHRKIAPLFGIHKSVVSGIVTRARWAWLKEGCMNDFLGLQIPLPGEVAV